jgi:hypothetical protein
LPVKVVVVVITPGAALAAHAVDSGEAITQTKANNAAQAAFKAERNTTKAPDT